MLEPPAGIEPIYQELRYLEPAVGLEPTVRIEPNGLQNRSNRRYGTLAYINSLIISQSNWDLFNIITLMLLYLHANEIFSESLKPKLGLLYSIKKSFFGSK